MPTFPPFKTLGLFPKPATKEEVLFLGSFGNPKVSTSTLNTPKLSVPFWWLLYKVSYFVDWTFTVGSGETSATFSGSFGVQFLFNQTPNQKICNEDLLLIGDESWTSAPNPDDTRYARVSVLEPFQCESVHALFYVSGDEVGSPQAGGSFGASVGFAWYITSAPPLEYDSDQNYNISTEELEVDLPDGGVATLNKCVDLYDADYEEISATSNISNVEFEWYELE